MLTRRRRPCSRVLHEQTTLVEVLVIEHALHVWLNVAAILVLVGAAFYVSLLPYMTREK